MQAKRSDRASKLLKDPNQARLLMDFLTSQQERQHLEIRITDKGVEIVPVTKRAA